METLYHIHYQMGERLLKEAEKLAYRCWCIQDVRLIQARGNVRQLMVQRDTQLIQHLRHDHISLLEIQNMPILRLLYQSPHSRPIPT